MAGEKMFKILVIDDDAISNKKFEDLLKGKTQFNLTMVASVEKAVALIAPQAKEGAPATEPLPPPLGPQLIFVNITKIVGGPLKWHTEFREHLKTGGNENVPIILLSASSDPILIRDFIAPGVHDAFVKPVVSTILESTLNYYLNGEKEQPRKLVPIKGSVEMHYQAIAKEISEFEMKIATPKHVELEDFKPIFGNLFKWSPNRRVIGRCTDSKNDEEIKGSFIETFTFVGVPPGITKEVRVWLRNEYVEQKKGDQQ